MTANEIRKAFLDFFISKNHHIVPSAPMVVKNDPTLMFTNAGMNQFKDLFLGNSPIVYPRIADSQKCLRVSGKHNDLEEVGHDTYHHTMFEMLGNWSFGNYFKAEAIEWAWEFLTETLKIDKSIIYVTVFEGDAKEKLDFDQEAYDIWKKYIAEDRILRGNKKDFFTGLGNLFQRCSGLINLGHGFIKVNDMDPIAFHENIGSHGRVPFAAQVSKLDTGIE